MIFNIKSDRNIYYYFLIIFIILVSLLTGVIGFFYYMETEKNIMLLRTEESFNLKLQQAALVNNFNTIVSDLRFLARQNELQHYLDNSDPALKEMMEEEYIQFAEKRGYYDQIRFLDESGMEVVRVNYKNGYPEAEKEEKLQQKAGRYYFSESIKLAPYDIFISPLDLNIENGKIEIPFKPVIRFASPVSDSRGNKKGTLILNYLANNMIDTIVKAFDFSPGEKMILNSDSFWLHGPIESNKWGFIIPERKMRKFSADYPDEWEKINSENDIQIYTENGIFTSLTIYPGLDISLPGINPDKDGNKHIHSLKGHYNFYWKLVSHIPEEKLKNQRNSILLKYVTFGSLLFIFSAFLAWLFAQIIIRRKMSRIKLFRSANYDKLTDLPNRSYLMHRLKSIISESERYKRKFALLFLDLDGFKEVNDTFGHDAGDKVLIQTAERFRAGTRNYDIIARIGGDEFIIILPSINSSSSAEKVAKKLLEAIKTPYEISGTKKRIGISIGISIFPDSGNNIDDLINNADKAMYEVKNKGKNGYKIFDN